MQYSASIRNVYCQTTTPHNYKPVEDFEITIRENNPDKPQVWKVLLDKEFSAKLKIIKKDDETKKPVLVAGTEFKIYDLDHKKYVEQVTTYPTVTVDKSFFTDSQGYLILPKDLEIGHYRIEEVTAPDGYVVNKNYVEITVDSDTAYEVDGISGDVIIELSYENQPVKGNLVVYKKGRCFPILRTTLSIRNSTFPGRNLKCVRQRISALRMIRKMQMGTVSYFMQRIRL